MMDASFTDPILEIPGEIPVMTLPDTVLFPQAILPLYIFEPRYRKMLSDVLDSNRLFAVAGLKTTPGDGGDELQENGAFEPPYDVATIGIVRACHENEDGTSNLILQGLSRVHFECIITETPYRLARITPLYSSREKPEQDLISARRNCLRMIDLKLKLSPEHDSEAYQFLHQIHDPEVFIDLASFSLLAHTPLKQKLLETTGLEKRFSVFQRWLAETIQDLELDRELKGPLSDDDILNN